MEKYDFEKPKNEFNKISNITISAQDVEKSTVLTYRYDFLSALEFYRKKTYTNTITTGPYFAFVRSRLQTLFENLYPLLERTLDKGVFEMIKKGVYDKKITEDQAVEYFRIINKELDRLNLTRLDIVDMDNVKRAHSVIMNS